MCQARSGNPAGELIRRDDCVLVIVDMQEKLLAVMSEKEKTLENNVKLARFAGIVGIPVLVTEQEKLGPTVAELRGVIEGFEPIGKLEFNACQRGEFARALEGLGRSTVLLTGIESHICITQTALCLLRGYNVHVISDAVASRAPENREIALLRMGQAGVVISSTEMAIYELLGRAGTDEFKETLELVK